jgi:type IV secretory pathway VirB10-like protein
MMYVVTNLWVLSNYSQTILENLMISRIARLSLAALISATIGITPVSVMAADPAPATPPAAAPAPAATPTDKAAEKKAKKAAKKEKKAEKKAKKKSKKKAKPAADAATQ